MTISKITFFNNYFDSNWIQSLADTSSANDILKILLEYSFLKMYFQVVTTLLYLHWGPIIPFRYFRCTLTCSAKRYMQIFCRCGIPFASIQSLNNNTTFSLVVCTWQSRRRSKTNTFMLKERRRNEEHLV